MKSEHELFSEWWDEEGDTISKNLSWRESHARDIASSAFRAGLRRMAEDTLKHDSDPLTYKIDRDSSSGI